MKYDLHPACAAWPAMARDDLHKLANDIRVNGLREPATITPAGLMLDGRNRALACEIAGVELTTTTYDGGDEIAFVISKNLHRRHLSIAELAFIGATLATLKHGATDGFRGNQYQSGKSSQEGLPNSITKSAAVVSKQLGIGHASIEDAKTIKERGTAEIIHMAKTRQVGLRDAATYARNTPIHEQKADVAEIRLVGGSINTGKSAGKKAKHKAKDKPPKIAHPPRMILDLPSAEEIKGLDRNQRTHLWSYTAKQMIDAQTIVTVLIGALAGFAGAQVDGATFFTAIDKMLAWKVIPGAKHGEQHDYAAKARKILDQLDRIMPSAIARFESFRTEWKARRVDLESSATAASAVHGAK